MYCIKCGQLQEEEPKVSYLIANLRSNALNREIVFKDLVGDHHLAIVSMPVNDDGIGVGVMKSA